jgi:hypothetical protein
VTVNPYAETTKEVGTKASEQGTAQEAIMPVGDPVAHCPNSLFLRVTADLPSLGREAPEKTPQLLMWRKTCPHAITHARQQHPSEIALQSSVGWGLRS